MKNSPNPIQIPQQMLIEVHQKIKRLNLIFVENTDLELQINYMSPIYSILRKQVIQKILEQTREVNLKCQNKYQKRNSLEERLKMKQLIEQIKNKTKNDPSEFLAQKCHNLFLSSKQKVEEAKEKKEINETKKIKIRRTS
ncbi:unnamed protein product [Paramecium pentaurelia]|uniref:Uncharacterized protein n=1 Tax=Paramecium pentaurelia TaxID=43138 RepID=A0A8S1VHJ0_9CILI|nr:unnamed protein product [Paramecium pentaurelia]